MLVRLVVHDWERDYYRSGIKELGYKVEKEVNKKLKISRKSFKRCELYKRICMAAKDTS